MDTVEDIEMIPSVGTKLHLVFCSETNMGFVNTSIHLPYEMFELLWPYWSLSASPSDFPQGVDIPGPSHAARPGLSAHAALLKDPPQSSVFPLDCHSLLSCLVFPTGCDSAFKCL